MTEMNIFVLDSDPAKAAEFHCDNHVGKMLLESVQMLSTVRRLYGYTAPYRATHPNHPATVWVRESRANYVWLYDLARELDIQHVARFGTRHSSGKALSKVLLVPAELPDTPRTKFAQCMPPKYQHADAVVAYRKFYAGEKAHFATWRNEEPYWWRIMCHK